MNSRAPIRGLDRPSRASRATCASCAVSSTLISTVRLRAVSPGGLHLAAGPLSQRIHTHRVQHVVGGTQLLAPRRDGARGAATPPRAGERGQLGAERGPAHPLDRLSVPALGRVAVAEQGADGAPIASTHSVGVTRVRSDSNSSAAHSSATSPVLDAASASSGTIWDPYPSVRLEGPSRRVAGGGVLPEAVVQERARVGREADQPDHTACNRLPRYGLDQFRRLPLLPRQTASIIAVSAIGGFPVAPRSGDLLRRAAPPWPAPRPECRFWPGS